MGRVIHGDRWKCPPHVALIDQTIAEAAYGLHPIVVISVPPRHGKSWLCSHHLPPWLLGNWPDRRVILAGYEAEFAASWGRKARDVLTEHGPELFGVTVRGDSSAANRWQVAGHAGEMVTAGIGGPILGRGADVLILDDVVKNAEEALSKTIRDKHWDWYLSTALTRLEPGGFQVVIASRWHTDDLPGRIIRKAHEDGRPIRIIRLPALAEADDPLGRADGEALWPERYNRAKLLEIKNQQGYWFPALYQQRPVPHGGALFKAEWFRTFKLHRSEGRKLPDGITLEDSGRFYVWGTLVVFVMIDPSLGKDERSDDAALGVFAVTPDGDLVVLHVTARTIPVEDLVSVADGLCRAWEPEWVGFEANGFQVTVANQAGRELDCTVREIDPRGKSKLVRGVTAINLANQGKLYVPNDAAWKARYIEQLTEWTGNDGDADDQVDITSYAAREVSNYASSDDVPGTSGGRSW